jgi:CheY-like chemotaxis protein
MRNVLVVDDEAAVRLALKRVLDRAGYAVRTASNAQEGMAELRAQPADIVITDIIMPKTDGVELIRAIVSEFPRVRIVAISGGGSYGIGEYKPNAITTTAYLSAAQSAGAHAVLTKPFGASDVLQAIAMRVLVVDDDEAIRAALTRVLEQAGYAVRTAPDVDAALQELRAQPADIAIVDILMPQVDGVVAIRAIAAEFPALRIVAMSGGGNDGVDKPRAVTTRAYLAAARDAGAHDAIAKPFDVREVLQAIGHAGAP